LSGYLYLTPYISIFLFKSAVERNDPSSVEKYINVLSLRKSLKPQLKTYVENKIIYESTDSFLPRIGVAVLDPVINVSVDSIVNSIVSVKGLRLLIEKGQLIDFKDVNKANVKSGKREPNNNVKLYYKGINIFVLSSYIPEVSIPINSFWERERIFTWKLISIELPPEILE
tara:strand:- start:154 stop:666 length:513 start_codon:yes stop_codon:yes gene_type:complete